MSKIKQALRLDDAPLNNDDEYNLAPLIRDLKPHIEYDLDRDDLDMEPPDWDDHGDEDAEDE